MKDISDLRFGDWNIFIGQKSEQKLWESQEPKQNVEQKPIDKIA